MVCAYIDTVPYIKSPGGILVPKFPSTGSGARPTNAPGVGFGNPQTGRLMTGGVTNPSLVLPGYLHRDLLTHIHGRIVAATQAMTGIAFLRSSEWVNENEVVSAAKAAYQDARGTTAHPRAHRFPCNPKLGLSDPPEIAGRRSLPLGGRFRAPYAATDFLPRVFNYADQLFEEGGAIQTVERAVRFALGEQAGGKTVNANLVRHTITHIIIPGFQQAYEHAYDEACSKQNPLVPDVSITDPGFFQAMTDASMNAQYNDRRPLLDIETVQDILAMSRNAAGSFVPPNADQGEIANEVQTMQAMLGL